MNQVSKKENIVAMWFVWHFYQMPRFLFDAWKNFLFFSLDFFSAPLLLSTLFSPWRKYTWSYPKGFSIIEYINTFLSNLFSRFIGAIARIILIILGALAQIIIFIVGIVVIVFWLAIPFLAIALAILIVKT